MLDDILVIRKYLHSWYFTEKPYSKPLEHNVVYILKITLSHAKPLTSNQSQ